MIRVYLNQHKSGRFECIASQSECNSVYALCGECSIQKKSENNFHKIAHVIWE